MILHNNKVRSPYNDVYGTWDRFWKSEGRPTIVGRMSHKKAKKITFDLLLELKLPYDIPILDIGCGSGETLQTFQKLGFVNINGIDNSREALKLCIAKGFTLNRNIFRIDATKTPFENGRFELIFSWGLLEHFTDFSPFVREMARLSRRYILLVQPNPFSLYGKLLKFLADLFRHNVREHAYRIEDFIDAFNKVGFRLKILSKTPLREFMVLLFEHNKEARKVISKHCIHAFNTTDTTGRKSYMGPLTQNNVETPQS